MLSKIYLETSSEFIPTREKIGFENINMYVSLTLPEIYPEFWKKEKTRGRITAGTEEIKVDRFRMIVPVARGLHNPILPRLKLVSSRPSPDRSPGLCNESNRVLWDVRVIVLLEYFERDAEESLEPVELF